MRLTIVIPVFNMEKSIENTIKSLFSQSKNDFEVIFVDDGSTDKSIYIAKKLCNSNSSNFRFYKQNNSGVSSARNYGMMLAKSDYILFLDADDLIHPDFVSMLSTVTNQKYDLIIYQYAFRNSKSIDSNTYGLIKEEGPIEIHEELNNYFSFNSERMKFHLSSMVFRRKFLLENEILFDESIQSGEDSLFVFKAMICTKSVYNIPKLLFYYIQTEGSVTNSYNIRLLDSFKSMTVLSELFIENRMNKISQLVDLKSSLLLQSQLYNLKKRARHLSPRKFLDEIAVHYPNLGDDLRRKVTNSRKGVKGLKLHLLWLEALVFSLIFGYLFRSAKP